MAALKELKPDAVLIEGPPDATEVLPLAKLAGMKPPVALLVYEPDAPEHAAYYPFAEFSPEWQAIRWALSKKADVRFIDLPCANWPRGRKPPPTTGEDEGSDAEAVIETPDHPRDPLDELARAAGYEDGEFWWGRVVEERRGDEDPLGVFGSIRGAMGALREQAKGARDENEPPREAHMRRSIRAALDEGFERIAVVCGAWHAPVLTAAALEAIPAKDDEAALKGLPKRKTLATWIPWTNSRLSMFSGYGAGILSPGWYEHLWVGHQQITERWMTRVARLMREEDLDASPAHVIEAVRLAESLAALRGRSIAGLEEMNEATLSILCHGNPLPMRVIHEQLIVGERLGEVPDDAPTVPLARDLARLQTSLRLKPTADEKLLDLDQRNETDLARSRLLHRLSILGVLWGERQETRGKVSTFHEQWKLQWKPELALAVIEAAKWGNTIEDAAAACVADRAGRSNALGELAAMLEHVLLADLPAAVERLVTRIAEVSAVGSDIAALMDALPPLAGALRYGNVRKTDLDMLRPVVAGVLARVCAGLLPACGSLDDDAANEMARRLAAVHAALVTLQNDVHLAAWQERLAAVGDAAGVHGRVAGLCWRVLLDRSAATPDDVASRLSVALSRGNDPSKAAAWLEGFLSGSGVVLLHDDRLFAMLDEWLCGLPADAFETSMPIVRRTFSEFPPAERRQIGERVRRAAAGGPAAVRPAGSDTTDYNAARGDLVIPVLKQILGEEYVG